MIIKSDLVSKIESTFSITYQKEQTKAQSYVTLALEYTWNVIESSHSYKFYSKCANLDNYMLQLEKCNYHERN